MKKTLSLILALLMSISCASFVAADDAIADENAAVEAPTAYDEAILFLQDNKIMQGYEDGLIHAEKPVERYMMALLNARISTGWTDNTLWEDDIANDSGYTDLAGTVAADYYGALSYADQKGIVEGYPDGSFKPEQQVTYREALAMATRTLGYTGLKWPWGNIEKAINLGLTEGIEEINFTTPLNRGQVAQIIYNTLFAKVNGETLAMNIFGIDRAWETILVTSTDRATYVAGGSIAKDGLVGFQIVNENGTLDSNVYYVAEADFELGVPYRALFNIDEDDNLVELVAKDECDVIATAENVGITNNEGKAIDDAYPVNTLIDKYTLTDKYHFDNVLANDNYVEKELILVDGTKMTTVTKLGDLKYGYEIATGNIVELATGAIKWYYDARLECYFEIKTVNGLYLVDVVDDEDVADLLGDLYTKVTSATAGYDILGSKPGKSAYSSVKIWDLNDKAYGMYEAYKLGVYSEGSDGKCTKCDKKDLKTYTLKDITGYAEAAADLADKDLPFNTYTLNAEIADGECDCVGYIFAEGYAPSADAKYVIYGVNKTTKEIKIVKEVEKLTGDVEDLTDMDTFYATGVVNGYRMSKKTITIGETSYNWEYDTLSGSDFAYVDKNTDTKALYTDYFAKIFGQFVEYVVVDGKIVHIEALNADSDTFIVVESFAGISSDNYIVVNGYSTDSLVYDQFRIAAYDGHKFGDKFWYGSNLDADFARGAVYAITSYNPDVDAYYVSTVGFGNRKESFKVGLTDVTIDATNAGLFEDGYVMVGDKAVKNEGFKVVILTGYDRDTMPFYVHSGKIGADWFVDGEAIYTKDNKTFIFVDHDHEEFYGFNQNAWEYSMVVLFKNVITDMVYDGYGTEYAWYLQGATGMILEAFDIFTGNMTEVCAGYHYDLDTNVIYSTVKAADGKSVILNELNTENWYELRDRYFDMDKETAEYIIDMYAAGEYLFDKDELSKKISQSMLDYNYQWTGFVSSLKTYKVTLADGGNKVTEIKAISKDDYKAMAADMVEGSINSTVIYNVADKAAVVYVYAGTGTPVVKPTTADTKAEVIVETDEFEDVIPGVNPVIKASANYTTLVEDNKVVGFAINSFTFEIDVDATCANLSKWGYNFGLAEHDFRDYTFAYRFGDADYTVSLEDVTLGTVSCTDADCDKNLVNKITIDVTDAEMEYIFNDFTDNSKVADRHFKLVVTNRFANEFAPDVFVLDATGWFTLGEGNVLQFVDTDYADNNCDNTDYFNGNTYNVEIAQ